MKWDYKVKEQIQYIFAGTAFVFGLILVAVAAFFIEPLGVVDSTIITIFGLILSFVGAILGINLHYSNETTKFKIEAREELQRFEEETNKRFTKQDDNDESTDSDA